MTQPFSETISATGTLELESFSVFGNLTIEKAGLENNLVLIETAANFTFTASVTAVRQKEDEIAAEGKIVAGRDSSPGFARPGKFSGVCQNGRFKDLLIGVDLMWSMSSESLDLTNAEIKLYGVFPAGKEAKDCIFFVNIQI